MDAARGQQRPVFCTPVIQLCNEAVPVGSEPNGTSSAGQPPMVPKLRCLARVSVTKLVGCDVRELWDWDVLAVVDTGAWLSMLYLGFLDASHPVFNAPTYKRTLACWHAIVRLHEVGPHAATGPVLLHAGPVGVLKPNPTGGWFGLCARMLQELKEKGWLGRDRRCHHDALAVLGMDVLRRELGSTQRWVRLQPARGRGNAGIQHEGSTARPRFSDKLLWLWPWAPS